MDLEQKVLLTKVVCNDIMQLCNLMKNEAVEMNKTVGNSQLIQKMNRLKVLNYIRKNPDVSRPLIAHETGLSVASLTNITSYLLDAGLITESGTEKAERVGRKGTLLRFCAETYGLIFVFVSVDFVNISYTDMEGRIITRIRVKVEDMQPSKVVELVREKVASLVREHGCKKILGIGVAVAGIVLEGSRFVASASLKWKEFDLKSVLEKETGIPVFVENISLLKAVWYFSCGSWLDKENMLLLDLENGIGASQFYQGEINRAMLGEIGHTTVEKDGELCFCGNRGCLETMCSEQRILKLYEEAGGEHDATFDIVSEKYLTGDMAAKKAVENCGKYLGIGLANLVNLCKPSVIVINMGVYANLRPVIECAVQEMKKRAYPALLRDIEIREVNINEENTVRGAAFNLCDRIFDIEYSGNVIMN